MARCGGRASRPQRDSPGQRRLCSGGHGTVSKLGLGRGSAGHSLSLPRQLCLWGMSMSLFPTTGAKPWVTPRNVWSPLFLDLGSLHELGGTAGRPDLKEKESCGGTHPGKGRRQRRETAALRARVLCPSRGIPGGVRHVAPRRSSGHEHSSIGAIPAPAPGGSGSRGSLRWTPGCCG